MLQRVCALATLQAQSELYAMYISGVMSNQMHVTHDIIPGAEPSGDYLTGTALWLSVTYNSTQIYQRKQCLICTACGYARVCLFKTIPAGLLRWSSAVGRAGWEGAAGLVSEARCNKGLWNNSITMNITTLQSSCTALAVFGSSSGEPAHQAELHHAIIVM